MVYFQLINILLRRRDDSQQVKCQGGSSLLFNIDIAMSNIFHNNITVIVAWISLFPTEQIYILMKIPLILKIVKDQYIYTLLENGCYDSSNRKPDFTLNVFSCDEYTCLYWKVREMNTFSSHTSVLKLNLFTLPI